MGTPPQRLLGEMGEPPSSQDAHGPQLGQPAHWVVLQPVEWGSHWGLLLWCSVGLWSLLFWGCKVRHGPFQNSTTSKGGERPHGSPQFLDTSCQKGPFARTWQVCFPSPILKGLGISQGLLGLSLPVVLAGYLWVWNQQECLPTDAFWGSGCRIVIDNLGGPGSSPRESERKLIPSGQASMHCLHEGWPPTPPTSLVCQSASPATHPISCNFLWRALVASHPSSEPHVVVCSPKKDSRSGSRVGGGPKLTQWSHFCWVPALYAASLKGLLLLMTPGSGRWHVFWVRWG